MYLQVTFMASPHLGPYTCVYSTPQRNPLVKVPRCLHTLSAVTTIVTVSLHSNIPLPFLYYPYTKSLPLQP